MDDKTTVSKLIISLQNTLRDRFEKCLDMFDAALSFEFGDADNKIDFESAAEVLGINPIYLEDYYDSEFYDEYPIALKYLMKLINITGMGAQAFGFVDIHANQFEKPSLPDGVKMGDDSFISEYMIAYPSDIKTAIQKLPSVASEYDLEIKYKESGNNFKFLYEEDMASVLLFSLCLGWPINYLFNNEFYRECARLCED